MMPATLLAATASTAPAVPSPATSAVVLATLTIVLLAAIGTFWALVDRSTSRRQWVALSEWSRDEGFVYARTLDDRPEPFDLPSAAHLPLRIWLANRTRSISIVQLGPWHLLIHKLEGNWKPTGLKPTHDPQSVLDLFPLTSFPLMGSTERFVVYGSDPDAALLLSKSSARALLPPDIGLLVHGRQLVLDFSRRPFDSIELNRMRYVAAQLAALLPVPPA